MTRFKQTDAEQIRIEVPSGKTLGIRNFFVPNDKFYNYYISLDMKNDQTNESTIWNIIPNFSPYHVQSGICQIRQVFEIPEGMSVSIKVKSIYGENIHATAYVDCDFFKHPAFA
jgi:hypothetical protein